MPSFILHEGETPFSQNLDKLKKYVEQLKKIGNWSWLTKPNLDHPKIQWRVYNILIQKNLLPFGGGRAVEDTVHNTMVKRFKDNPPKFEMEKSIVDKMHDQMLKLTPRAGYELGLKFYFGFHSISGGTKRYSLIIIPILSPNPNSTDDRDHENDEERTFLQDKDFFVIAPDTDNYAQLKLYDGIKLSHVAKWKDLIKNKESGYSHAAYYYFDRLYTDFIKPRLGETHHLLLEFGRLGNNKLSVIISCVKGTSLIIKPVKSRGDLLVYAESTYFDNGDLYPPSNVDEEIFK